MSGQVIKQRVIMSIVWHLPRWLIYWCAIRLIADATTGKYSNQITPELTALDALRRWEIYLDGKE